MRLAEPCASASVGAQDLIDIPICADEPAAQTAARLHARGRFLARQDEWEQLAIEIRAADSDRALTPGLSSQAVHLAEGARSDISDAVAQGAQRDDAAEVKTAVAALDPLLLEFPDCPIIAYIVAMAHVDASQAWLDTARAGRFTPDQPANRHKAYARHMATAILLNDRFDPFEQNTPLWALVRCAVLAADPNPQTRVADDYEDLIDLDHGNPHHLVQFGNALRPKRFGSWDVLDAQARRTALRTADVWGAGGYTWVYMGALGVDPGAYRPLDAELFVEGLHDILARHPSQNMANRMAAFVGHSLGGQPVNGKVQRRLAECLGWIAQDYLREIHPQVWAATPRRPNELPVTGTPHATMGQTRALSALTEFYAPALDAGRRLVFGTDGLRMVKDT